MPLTWGLKIHEFWVTSLKNKFREITEWVFVYELSVCKFEYRCCHLSLTTFCFIFLSLGCSFSWCIARNSCCMFFFFYLLIKLIFQKPLGLFFLFRYTCFKVPFNSFICFLAASRSTLIHFRGDSLNNHMLIIAF